MEFSHYADNGTSTMVDVSGKMITVRNAWARGFVRMQQSTLDLITNQLLPKGNPFEVARVAGIIAAKQTANLIPMCHPLLPEFIGVELVIDAARSGVAISSEIRMEGKTGAEMEALTAVTVAALTLYDMCKAVDKEMVIEDVTLVKKTGGKSDYQKK